MKIRNGFVSNSSTSSFIVIMKQEHFEKGLEMVHPYVKACIEALGHSKGKFLGEDVVSLGTMDTPGGSQWEWIDVEYDEEEHGAVEDPSDMKYGSLDLLINEVEKVYGKDAVLTTGTDC